ncbi:Ubiquinone biosynthesis O-methyltransferase [bacterium HR11]|nr:Ubiquinone biosynthesis O-methyltransferase [bacterium HR11]
MEAPTLNGSLHATLVAMSQAPRLYRWIWDELRPYVGRVVLEIGAGLGYFTEQMARLPGRVVYATDIDSTLLSVLTERLGHWPHVFVSFHDATRVFTPPDGNRPDTVLCLNVLEHIEDDVKALRGIYGSLAPGGHLLLLVPAHPWLYGTVDRAIGHFRRYPKRDLLSKLRATGFQVVRLWPFNPLGIVGWWWQGKVRRGTRLEPWQTRWFDRLVPIVRRVPVLRGGWVGLSWLVVARKPDET